jgi:hypothetical protein
VSLLEAHREKISALVAKRPDLTLKETLAELLKQRIRTLQRLILGNWPTVSATCR